MRGAPVGVGDGWHGGGRLGDRAEKEEEKGVRPECLW